MNVNILGLCFIIDWLDIAGASIAIGIVAVPLFILVSRAVSAKGPVVTVNLNSGYTPNFEGAHWNEAQTQTGGAGVGVRTDTGAGGGGGRGSYPQLPPEPHPTLTVGQPRLTDGAQGWNEFIQQHRK